MGILGEQMSMKYFVRDFAKFLIMAPVVLPYQAVKDYRKKRKQKKCKHKYVYSTTGVKVCGDCEYVDLT